MLIPMERMTYSCDVQSKALSVRKSEGLTIRETVSDADRLSEGHAVAKTDEARPSVPRRRTLEKTALLEDMQQYRDAYPHESAARFNVSQGALWRALRTPGITDQKKRCAPRRTKTHGLRSRTTCERIAGPIGQSSQNAGLQAGYPLESLLPNNSPDLNPIEHVWARAQAIRRIENCSIDALCALHLS